ncbi:hypothetical protein LTR66_016459 [Elasticomyces elasticus]|nr:hypothetical protein LTR66_016459 [Elasticomyces elasticus]
MDEVGQRFTRTSDNYLDNNEHLLPELPTGAHHRNSSSQENAAQPRATARPYTERHTVNYQHLSILEAASLIINKMIGTGIFTTPGLILHLTQNKGLALALWILGGFYAAVCLLVYLDYGTGLPYNGAELIYLTRVYDFSKTKMLPPILFASFFVVLYHTAGNAISAARFMIIASEVSRNSTLADALANSINTNVTADGTCLASSVDYEPSSVAVKSYAILVLALDWGYQSQNGNSFVRLSAFIYIAYSYNGWENACYILGQVNKDDASWRPKIR